MGYEKIMSFFWHQNLKKCEGSKKKSEKLNPAPLKPVAGEYALHEGSSALITEI